jgi:nucleoid DNA-binding protein
MPALSLNDKQIGLLISAVFKHINHELNRLGVIKIQGLGVFTVRSTSNENRVSNKRIIFKNSDE